MGFDRSVRYGSLFFDDYKDVGVNLWEEDTRFTKAWWMYMQGRDPIQEMINIFVDQCVAGLTEKEMGFLYEKLSATLAITTHLSSKYVTSMAIRGAISEAIYSLILKSEALKLVSRGVIGGTIMAFGSYGFLEKASLAKERLRIQNPIYYWSLYISGIEMLYFLVEERLGCGLHLISKTRNGVIDVYQAFMKVFYG
ncbi:hypothetical protein ABRP32_12365 [Providencia manganoxydans]|uniref:hypothetical protein n=1 Tax=Providencia manganoxydans TaxID=2923283 RepID=UPI003AF3C6AA